MPAGKLKTVSNCPNSGDDIAGIVAAVGSDVYDFHIGDRVAALHELGAPYGSYAEYALVYEWTTFHIGDVNFDVAATVPMASLMASIGLFGMLKVADSPWTANDHEKETPLVIYGAAGAVGAYATKLAMMMNIHPLICVAGNGIPFVQSLIGPEDVIVDYRKGSEAVVQGIKDALKGRKLHYAFDATTEHGSWNNLCKVLAKGGKLCLVLPGVAHDIPDHIQQSTAMAGSLWKVLAEDASRATNKDLGHIDIGQGGKDFGLVFSRLIGKWLREGRLANHPYQVMPGGLLGVETALKDLRGGKVTGTKYVVRIAETPGLNDSACQP